MQDLRPISLCSVHYKIVSKILFSRLSQILPNLISETQGAFVEGRLISDNIIIAHEVTHALRTDPSISSEFIAVKSDMSKAFDRVEWSFMRALLSKLGFSEVWISWIMTCISTVSYSIILNGRLYGNIKPERGIRQGDHLSPFLFIPGAEAFVAVLKESQRLGKLTGVSFSSTGPSLTHLLFADDSLLMCKASIADVQELARCLEIYGAGSGQMINFQKSSITFGSNVEMSLRLEIKAILNIEQEGGTSSYLGLPEYFSGSKRQLLRFIHDKLKSRLQGWFSKALSQGGKEILLKSICLALPVYAMSCFRLPKDLCDRLTSAMTEFWWSSGNNRRKISWVAWKKLCFSKEDGGLGFHDITDFNQSLLCKQAWRILEQPESLFSRVLKSRYIEFDHFLAAPLGYRPSFAWRSILHGRDLLLKGILRSIGDGRETYALTANWIWDGTPCRPICSSLVVDPLLRVVDLIDRQSYTWKEELVRDLFQPQDASYILNLRISRDVRDSFVWGYTPHGHYTSQTGYKLLRTALPSSTPPLERALWSKVWKLKSEPKINHFLWKCLAGALPVADRLQTRNINVSSVCLRCSSSVETICHMLFNCPASKSIWDQSGIILPPSGFSTNSVFLNIHHLVSTHYKNPACKVQASFPWILWEIWKARTALVFERMSLDPMYVFNKASEASSLFFESSSSVPETAPFTLHRWMPLPSGFKKCNLAGIWKNSSTVVGFGWLLRNENGTSIYHGRDSSPKVNTRLKAELLSLQWAAQSLSSMRQSNVIFETSSSLVVQAIQRPSLFPAHRLLVQLILRSLSLIPNWSIAVTHCKSNMIASRIASSATEVGRHNSYIQTLDPPWLAADIILEAAFL